MYRSNYSATPLLHYRSPSTPATAASPSIPSAPGRMPCSYPAARSRSRSGSTRGGTFRGTVRSLASSLAGNCPRRLPDRRVVWPRGEGLRVERMGLVRPSGDVSGGGGLERGVCRLGVCHGFTEDKRGRARAMEKLGRSSPLEGQGRGSSLPLAGPAGIGYRRAGDRAPRPVPPVSTLPTAPS